jgi:hypothetical protein
MENPKEKPKNMKNVKEIKNWSDAQLIKSCLLLEGGGYW